MADGAVQLKINKELDLKISIVDEAVVDLARRIKRIEFCSSDWQPVKVLNEEVRNIDVEVEMQR